MSDSGDNLSNDYHINASYQQPTVLPKVRSDTASSSSNSTGRHPSVKAVPATPRMLRNSSGNFQQQQQQALQQQPLQPVQAQQQNTLSGGQQQRYYADQLTSPQRSNSARVQRTPSSAARYNQYQNDQNRNNSPSRQALPQIETQLASSSQQPQRTPSQRGTPTKLLPPANVSTPPETSTTSKKSDSTPVKRPTQGQFHRRSIGEWDFMKTVGAGSMGKVKLAKHRKTSEVCAIKIVPRAARIYERNHANAPPPLDEAELQKRRKDYDKEVARDRRTIREASLGKILYHPFICRLFEVITMSNHYYMLFEYVSGGQMLDYIVSHGSLKERHARKFARGIASALDYLHKNNVVHRDLKIENIMISKTGDIKIIDFGLSNMYSNDSLLKTYCGSLYFAAPELLCAHPYIGPEVDVWSFGVVLYVLVCGKVPFDDQSVSSLHEKIKKGKVEYPAFLSPEVVTLLSRMLVVNPNKRAKLSEILAHPWMIKGYENQPLSFVPHRTPLTLPLDPTIIKEMYALELGESEEQIADDLSMIISSDLYSEASKHWFQLQNTPALLKVDPTTSFHPLVSIYYLVDEMLKRRQAKASIIDVPNALPDLQDEQQQQAKASEASPDTIRGSDFQPLQPPELKIEEAQQEPPKLQTPTQPPTLSFPEAAHTSPIHAVPIPDTQQVLSSNTAANEELAVPQQHHPKQQAGSIEDKGFNSLIRKFSQLRAKRSHDAPVQRTNSVNIGNRPQEHDLNAKYQAFTNNQQPVQRVGSLRVKTNTFNNGGLKPEVHNAESQSANKSHNRAVSAYTGGTLKPEAAVGGTNKANETPQTRKFHPSARAKSVGHRRDHPHFANADNHNELHQLPPLASDLNDDAFFDDVTLDEYPNSDKVTLVNSRTSGTGSTTANAINRRGQDYTGELTEEQIMEKANRASAGTMPSIEYPRTLFLKGFFSVQTTSTKPLPVIRANIISVLTKLDVQFTEVRGGFVCQHIPSIKQVDSSVKEEVSLKSTKSSSESTSGLQSNTTETNKFPHQAGSDNLSAADSSFTETQSTPTSASKAAHKRKFSIGGSILGYRRKASISAAPAMPPTPVASSNTYNQYDFDSSASLDSLNNDNEGHGGSDMLISSRIEQSRARAPSGNNNPGIVNANHGGVAGENPPLNSVSQSRTPLKFEIHIVKVPLVGLFGVQFKKVLGNTWMYKALAGQILNELKL